MKEEKMQVFVDIITSFFNQLGVVDVTIDTPYLLESEHPKVLEYTGVIGISGEHNGVVYVTATKELLLKTLELMGETDKSNKNIIDLIGEIANTVSGNARSAFGSEFNISVPIVFQGAPDGVFLPKNERSFVIPIEWHGHVGEIVICIQSYLNV